MIELKPGETGVCLVIRQTEKNNPDDPVLASYDHDSSVMWTGQTNLDIAAALICTALASAFENINQFDLPKEAAARTLWSMVDRQIEEYGLDPKVIEIIRGK